MSPENKTKLDLLNCAITGRVEFTFPCPVGWDRLQTTDDPRRRLCATCQRSVFRCHNPQEAALRAEQGECVAVPAWLVQAARAERPHTLQLLVGRLDYTRLLTALTEAHLASLTPTPPGDP